MDMRTEDRQAPALPADRAAEDTRPILLVPYMWIGDFVRCHTVVRLLKSRFPRRPVDVLATTMPGVRKGIVFDLPRRRIAFAKQRALAARLRAEGYGTALVMPRTWKSALAPWLAGIPERIGFAGEARFILLNDVRWGERRLERMIDRCAVLALPRLAPAMEQWPVPQLVVPTAAADAWRTRRGLADERRVAAFAPGAVGPSKRWPTSHFAQLARRLIDEGMSVWVLGSPDERAIASEIRAGGGPHVHDATGTDLRDAILALKAADVAVSNDSGLSHVAAAIGTPTIGVFGPTSPRLWAPLNPLAGVIEAQIDLPCRPCHQPVCRLVHHRCMQDIPAEQVLAPLHRALAALPALVD
jgi:heptosyltransferase-2